MNKTEKRIAVIAVVAVIAYVLWSGGYLSGKIPISPSGNGGGVNAGGTSINISTTAPTLNIQALAPNALANNNAGGYTSVATPVNVVQSGSPVALFASQTIAGSFNSVGSGSINGGTTYNVFCGENSNNYLNRTIVTAVTGKSVPTTCVVFQISAPTLTFKNATSAGFTVGGGQVRSVSSGQQINSANLQIMVTAGAGWFGYPGEGYVLDFSSNSTAGFSSIASVQCLSGCGSTTNLPSVTLGSLPPESTYTNDINYAFSAPAISAYGTQTFALSAAVGSAVSPNALVSIFGTTQNAVGLYLIPAVNYNYNGQFLTNIYVKPGVSGSVAAGSVTSNSVGIALTSHA